MSETPVTAESTAAQTPFDAERIRREFPALQLSVNGKPLVYLDNAASAHKPKAVLEAEAEFYRSSYSNVHRGVHQLSQDATEAYEGARRKVAAFLNAESEREIIFLRGTTEAINLVASSYGRPKLSAGDEILITEMEHHSNIVPWQLLCQETGAELKVAPMNDRGEIELEAFVSSLTERTRLVSVVHVSNALGSINPIAEMAAAARQRGVPILVDGAQAVPHMAIDVRQLGCDFYAFSAHKMFGPTGIGALYGRGELLARMPPYQGGGEMIRSVTFEKSEYDEPPARFEAGTPNIAGAVGLGAAIDFLSAIGRETISAREQELLDYALKVIPAIDGVRLIGTPRRRAAVLSFVVEGVHAHDVGTILDSEGIAVRAGHHCAQPVMDHYGLSATARASIAFYNTENEIDRLAAGIARVKEVFG